jgi:Uma2 family endonuclease
MAIEPRPHRFTVDQYEQMGTAGIFHEDDRVELLDGAIVEMNPIGSPHFRCVNRLNMLLAPALARRGAIVSVRNPVKLGEYWMPQPDVVLLRERADDYAGRQATPDDVLLLIEVADSSLSYDRAKLPAYARFSVAEVWLVDLNGELILCHREPLGDYYGLVRAYRRGGTISPQFQPELTLAVEAILP